MCVDGFNIVSLFLSNPCISSTLSKEAFVYFMCPTKIQQPPFESFRFHNKNFDEIRCKLDSTENPRSFEKYPTPP